jgi:hypothetical protein
MRIKFDSELVADLLNQILSDIDKTRKLASELIHRIKKISNNLIVTNIKVSEADEKEYLLFVVMNSIYQLLKSSNDYDNSDFRTIVYDSAGLILLLNGDIETKKKKNVFKDYLEQHFNLHKSYIHCINCGSVLFYDIPFCFNCFERN